MPANLSSPVYLVELFSLQLGGLDLTDVSADLALSLEEVYWHLFTFDEAVQVTVSENAEGELEGVAFLRADDSILATITVYRLDRESQDSTEHVKALHSAARLTGPGRLQDALTRLF